MSGRDPKCSAKEARPLTVTERTIKKRLTYSHDGQTRAMPWGYAVQEFKNWLRYTRASSIEVQNGEGESATVHDTTSYSEDYLKRYYAKLQQFHEQAYKAYTYPHSVMFSFTANGENAEGGQRCPLDHWDEIRDGWTAARRELHRVLDDVRFDYVSVVEVHGKEDEESTNKGYLHLHVGVVFEGDGLTDPNDDGRFQSVTDAYVDNAPSASKEAHDHDTDYIDCKALKMTEPGEGYEEDETLGNLGNYMAKYLAKAWQFGETDEDGEERDEGTVLAEELPDHIVQGYAVCWAGHIRRVRFSQGANKLLDCVEAWEKYHRDNYVGRAGYDALMSRSWPSGTKCADQWQLVEAKIAGPGGIRIIPADQMDGSSPEAYTQCTPEPSRDPPKTPERDE